MSVTYISHPAKPKSTNNNKDTHNILIYLIPGNPGLIGYYAPFLSHLREKIDANTSLDPINFHIYGQNLAGFSDDDHEPFTAAQKPHDLEYQIEYTLKSVSDLRTESGEAYDQILLIGHSVGSYIALEIFHRVLQRNISDASKPFTPKLTSGILLFPTITHISSSPSGSKLSLLSQTPLLGPNAHRIAQGFLCLWPWNALYWFVTKTLGFPPHAAEVTTTWLKSRDGVWQSLHLGMDEMGVINEDKWDEDLWGIEKSTMSSTAPETVTTMTTTTTTIFEKRKKARFYFLFGKEDHWVADKYRDEFIKKRSKQVEIIVDEDKVPHAFCIEHSDLIADKVQNWISEMYK